jgi:hypothetical protein
MSADEAVDMNVDEVEGEEAEEVTDLSNRYVEMFEFSLASDVIHHSTALHYTTLH